MLKKHVRQVITACMLAGLVLSSVTVWAPTALRAAPVAQTLEAQEVGGTLPGGEFAKIWLGLTPITQGQEMTIRSTWDRPSPGSNGVGFYILGEDGLREVLNGSVDVRDANLAAATRLSPESPPQELGAVVQATGGSYTIVMFNDSESDANFTLTAENGVISDDSDQVRDLSAAPTPASEEDEEGDAEEGDDAADEATPEASTEVTATAETTPTATATPEPAADETDEADAEEMADEEMADEEMSDESSVMASDGVVEAQVMRGELPNQNDQHYLGLEPSVPDGNIVLTLSFDPQDSSELARRLNFWVLDQTGFTRYTQPDEDVILSQIALAAGSSEPGLAENERQAQFTASGLGPYVVIVYNNSEVPGSYTLRVDGALLVDDSGQTITAQEASTGAIGATAEGSETVTDTATTTDTADTDDGGDTGTATETTTTTREGNPGETYTVQSGDTLSLIARDIYGDIDLWEAICSFNELDNCNTIEVGQTLQLPTQAQVDSGETAPAASTTTESTSEAAADTTTDTDTESASATATATDTVTGTATTGDDTEESDVESGSSVTSTTTTTETTETGDADSGDAADILTTLEAQGSFNTLVQALEAAALTDSLRTAGPFTIVAPTDAAFAELPETAMNQLLANPTGQLTQILLFHVLSGEVASSDITDEMQATTQQGQSVTFEVADGSIRVNGANVTAPDIQASNGVVHAIDAVLLPPSE